MNRVVLFPFQCQLYVGTLGLLINNTSAPLKEPAAEVLKVGKVLVSPTTSITTNTLLYSSKDLLNIITLFDDAHVGSVDQLQQGLECALGEVQDLINLAPFHFGSFSFL